MTSIEKIDAMIGASQYKETMHELNSIIPDVVTRGIKNTLFYQSYLFSIDKGCGLSTAALNMAEFLKLAGFPDIRVRTFELEAGSKSLEEDIRTLRDVAFHSYLNYILVLDIEAWMSKTGGYEFSYFLRKLKEITGSSTIIIFRIPAVEPEYLKKIHDGLSDVFYIKDVCFEKISVEDMREYAERIFSSNGFKMSSDAWSVFENRISVEKRDGRFYGYKTVGKVTEEIVFKKLIENARYPKHSSLISLDDISSMAEKEFRRGPYDKLMSLTGLQSVKKQIVEMVEQIKYLKSKTTVQMPCIHMRFLGNPGTGKTTVARIVGEILADCGILRNGGFYEYTGRNLVGEYIGQTAKITEGICRSAYGSVLFIDEAYSLYTKAEKDGKDFGKEALTALISEMENHRTDMVVIMAGYSDEMETLMEGNKGLESRMPYIINFENYTAGEMCDIFMSYAKADYEIEPGLKKAVKEYFENLPEDFVNAKEFANARFVRNLYERTQSITLNRCIARRAERIVITKGDLKAAISEEPFAVKAEEKIKIGF